jgi:Na+/melibiose symporter-like transporter
MTFKTEPLPAGFMIAGILGFIVSLIHWDKLGAPWAFTFTILSLIFFVGSMFSLRESIEIDKEHLKKKRTQKKTTKKETTTKKKKR